MKRFSGFKQNTISLPDGRQGFPFAQSQAANPYRFLPSLCMTNRSVYGLPKDLQARVKIKRCKHACRHAGLQKKNWIVFVIQHPAKQDNPVFIQFKKLMPRLVNSLTNYKII